MSDLQNQFQSMYELIEKSHFVLIMTHLNPDADTLGSALALGNYLFSQKINYKIINKSDQLPHHLDFLPRFEKIVNKIPKSYDLVVYVDCADQQRVGIDIDQSIKIINIDHHHSNKLFGDLNIVDSAIGSTAELLYSFFYANKLTLTKEIATCLYVGIYDDSIAFTTPRTTSKTFEIVGKLLETKIDITSIIEKYLMRDTLAKYRLLPKILETLTLHNEGRIATIYQKQRWLHITGASFGQCDGIVDEILKIAIVKVVIYLRENGDDLRISLRGKEKSGIDLSEFAARFGGGGHKNAAGITLCDLSIDEGIEKLVESLKLNSRLGLA